MASTRNQTPNHSSNHSPSPASRHNQSPSSTNQSPTPTLPPKPHTHKRTRNATSTTGLPPTAAHPSNPPRPRQSWTRRSATWTPDEDAKLIELVQKETSVPPSITASKTWSRVASQLNNRTGKQCRERYLNQLKPGIRRDPWSPEEERILQHSHARYGNKWVTIATHLPGRTDNCVKNHWNSMLRKRQRREAARRAANQPPSTTPNLPPALHPSPHRATLPSSSALPSPLTPSSPITPKRHVKLQISSLVAASSNQPPASHPNSLTRNDSSVSHSPTIPSLPPAQPRIINLPSISQSLPLNHHDQLAIPHSLSTSTSAPGPNPTFSYPAHSHHPTQATLPSSKHTPINSPSLPTDSLSPPAATTQPRHRHLRRSARLTSTQFDACSNTSPPDWKSKPRGIKKPATSNPRRHSSRTPNPLAALAAAASSVPPSPLTPESRFSGTSRSRSVSPSPRAIPDLANTTPANGLVMPVNLTKNMSNNASALPNSCKADPVKNSRITDVKD